MNIVHVSVASLSVLHERGGAIQRRILEIGRSQVKSGHSVVIYSVGDADEVIWLDGMEIRNVHCRLKMPMRAIEFQLRAMFNLWKRNHNIDVIHLHSQPEGSVLAKPLKSKSVVLTYDFFEFRGGKESPLSPIYREILKRYDKLLPVSMYCLEASSSYWDLPKSLFEVVYNGVNTIQFSPDSDKRTLGREMMGAGNSFVILYVGRVCRQKGADLLIEAAQLMGKTRDDVRFVVAGPIGQFAQEDDPEDWQSKMESAQITYLGAVPEEHLAAVYNAADVFVMPTNELEMFGMAVVEAQACGKPVVASDHGGLVETVPQECGGRFKVGDLSHFVQLIENLLDDPAKRQNAAEYAYQNALRFDWQHICQQLEAVYRG